MSNTNCLTGLVEVSASKAKAAAEATIANIMVSRRAFARQADLHEKAVIKSLRSRLWYRLFRHGWSDRRVFLSILDMRYFDRVALPGYEDHLKAWSSACSYLDGDLQICRDVVRAADILAEERRATILLSPETIRTIGL